MRFSPGRGRRRGAIAVLAAVVFLFTVSLAALAVDLAVMTLAQSQIRTAADAAALAGAIELASARRLAGATNLDQEMVLARDRARTIAKANLTLEAPVLIPDNSNNSSSGSIVVGYLDRTYGTTFRTSPIWTWQFDTVQVTARRDAQNGGEIPAFFSQVMGHRGFNVRATARATVRSYEVAGFNTATPGTTTLIPIALDLTLYTMMVNRLTTDAYKVSRNPTKVEAGADGIYESSMFPQTSGPGNWGLLNIPASSNSTQKLASQIANGVPTSDLSSLASGGVVKAEPPQMVSGNPGITLGIMSSVESIVGKDVVVPIYDPTGSTGTGNNFKYKIVQFATVTVLAFEAKGANSTLVVQPSYLRDPLAIPGDPQIDWKAGGLIRLTLTQ